VNYNRDLYKQFLNECSLPRMLTQNAKIKKSSNKETIIYNIGIPAWRSESGLNTCPQATHCVAGCYARQGTYQFPVVKRARENMLSATRTKGFIEAVSFELSGIVRRKPNTSILVRVHDSGDFYSETYQRNWYTIAASNPEVHFYAYTKCVTQSLLLNHVQPVNFRLIYSLGGAQDNLIDRDHMFHARVFKSMVDLNSAGYIDGTENDLVAAIGDCNKIGLCYHGTKQYNKTTWSKV
jgi:hypothetical protein